MPERDYEGIVVLGSPRSGTTLMRRLLSGHPDLYCPPETYLLTGASRFLKNDHFAGGLAAGTMPGLIFSGYEEEEVYARLREFVFGFFREIASKNSKSIWVEKTGVDAFHIEDIERVCTDRVRYVVIQRHGLDVACSMDELSSKMRAYLTELHHFIVRHQSPLVAFAHAWVDANERLLGLLERRPDRCIALRYEDLLDDPQAHLARVFGFLGLEADTGKVIEEGMKGELGVGLGDWKTYTDRALRKKSVGRAAELDDDTRSALARVVNPMLKRLGYDEVEIDPPGSITDACHRYQINQMVLRMQAAKAAAQREKP